MALDYSTADAGVVAAFGETLTFNPLSSPAFSITGLFQSPDFEPGITEAAELEVTRPRVIVLFADLDSASATTPPINHGDLVTARGVVYAITNIEQDESDLVVLHLQENS